MMIQHSLDRSVEAFNARRRILPLIVVFVDPRRKGAILLLSLLNLICHLTGEHCKLIIGRFVMRIELLRKALFYFCR